MMIGLYQIVQSLQMFSNTEASFEELDIPPSLCWGRDSVVVRKNRAAWINLYWLALQDSNFYPLPLSGLKGVPRGKKK